MLLTIHFHASKHIRLFYELVLLSLSGIAAYKKIWKLRCAFRSVFFRNFIRRFCHWCVHLWCRFHCLFHCRVQTVFRRVRHVNSSSTLCCQFREIFIQNVEPVKNSLQHYLCFGLRLSILIRSQTVIYIIAKIFFTRPPGIIMPCFKGI